MRVLQTGLLLLVVVVGLGSAALAEGAAESSGPQWQRLPDMPIGVFAAALSSSGQRAVITGGITQAGILSDVVQVFDLDRLRWSTPVRLPLGVCMHAQVSLPDGRVMVIGGQTGERVDRLRAVRDCYLVDVASGKVVEAATLPQALAAPTAHVLSDGRVIAIGGNTASIYDPKRDSWVRHIGLRESREHHASVLVDDDTVLVVGGVSRNSLEWVDVYRGVSRGLAVELPMPLDDHRLVYLKPGRVWVLGGQNGATGATTERTWLVDLRDPEGVTLQEGPRLGIAGGVADHATAAFGPWVLVAGGETEHPGRDIELSQARLLDTRDGRVWSLPQMMEPHDDAVAAAAPWGLVVFGGYSPKRVGSAHFTEDGLEITLPIASATVEAIGLPAQ